MATQGDKAIMQEAHGGVQKLVGTARAARADLWQLATTAPDTEAGAVARRGSLRVLRLEIEMEQAAFDLLDEVGAVVAGAQATRSLEHERGKVAQMERSIRRLAAEFRTEEPVELDLDALLAGEDLVIGPPAVGDLGDEGADRRVELMSDGRWIQLSEGGRERMLGFAEALDMQDKQVRVVGPEGVEWP